MLAGLFIRTLLVHIDIRFSYYVIRFISMLYSLAIRIESPSHLDKPANNLYAEFVRTTRI